MRVANLGSQIANGAWLASAWMALANCNLQSAKCADPPTFVLYSTHADLPAGPLRRLSADGTVQVGNAPPVASPDVVSIRRRGQAPPKYPGDRPQILFANGDRLPGRL